MILESIFALNKRETIFLNETDFRKILEGLNHDDFIIEITSNTQFYLIATTSLGTSNYTESSFEETIIVQCEINIQESNIELHFFAPVLKSIKLLMIIAVLALGFLAINIAVGLLLIAMIIIAIFWFNYIYKLQQKTMTNFFMEEIKRFKHFKKMGYDYLKRKGTN